MLRGGDDPDLTKEPLGAEDGVEAVPVGEGDLKLGLNVRHVGRLGQIPQT